VCAPCDNVGNTKLYILVDKVYHHLNKAIISNYVITGMHVHMCCIQIGQYKKLRVLRML